MLQKVRRNPAGNFSCLRVFNIFPAYASFLPQNGGNRVCEDLKFQNYPGEDVPAPPPLSKGLPSAAPFHRTASAKKKLDPPQQGMFTGVIYFDLKKAFDTLDKGLYNNYQEGGP